MKAAALSLVALSCGWLSVDAFTGSPGIRARPTTTSFRAASVRVNGALKEDDFVPSEKWLGEYMGEQGLRYALNKTPEEVEKEGDYTWWEKLFGQTSNNKARMDLKKKILEKANDPTDPERYQRWTAKYGYGRFFAVYVDKSGYGDDTPAESTAKKAGSAVKNFFGLKSKGVTDPKGTAAKASKAGVSGKQLSTKDAPVAKSPVYPKKRAAERVKAAGPAKSVPKAAAKVEAVAKKEVKKVAKPVAAAAKTVKGNIKNIPKAL